MNESLEAECKRLREENERWCRVARDVHGGARDIDYETMYNLIAGTVDERDELLVEIHRLAQWFKLIPTGGTTIEDVTWFINMPKGTLRNMIAASTLGDRLTDAKRK